MPTMLMNRGIPVHCLTSSVEILAPLHLDRGSISWSAEYLGFAEKLLNKANIIIQYYLVPYHLSTDSM